jgi:hypothetical protein
MITRHMFALWPWLGSLLAVADVAPERVGIVAPESSWIASVEGLAPSHITIVEPGRIASALQDLRKGGARCEVTEVACVSRIAAWARLSGMVMVTAQGQDLVASWIDAAGGTKGNARSPDGDVHERVIIARALLQAVLNGEPATGTVVVDGVDGEVLVDGEPQPGPKLVLSAGPHQINNSAVVVRAGLATRVVIAPSPVTPPFENQSPAIPIEQPPKEPRSVLVPVIVIGAGVVVTAASGVVTWLLLPSGADYQAGKISATDYNNQQQLAVIVGIAGGAAGLVASTTGVGMLLIGAE